MNKKGGLFGILFWIAIGFAVGIWFAISFIK